MNWSNLLEGICSLAITIITSFVIPYFISKIKNEKVKKLLNSLNDKVAEVVKEVYQTYVEALKKEDKFDEEAQKTALSTAKEKLESSLSDELKSYIEKNKVNLESLIESTIYTLKN